MRDRGKQNSGWKETTTDDFVDCMNPYTSFDEGGGTRSENVDEKKKTGSIHRLLLSLPLVFTSATIDQNSSIFGDRHTPLLLEMSDHIYTSIH